MSTQNKSFSEYKFRKQLGTTGRLLVKTLPPRYETRNTLTHQRMEEGQQRWIEYTF